VGGFVTIFGGSAISRTDPLYEGVMNFATRWTNNVIRAGGRYPILTGAGPGVMEAGNRGAMKAGGPSIGYTTYYGPAKQQRNPALAYQTYNDTQIVTDGLILSSIEMREILMINHSAVAIIAPGGTGTEWELFEVLDGIKNAQIDSIPVYLIGNRQKNWASFDSLLADMIRRGTAPSSVLSLFTYVENPVDVIPLLCDRLMICKDGEKKGRK
jgi:predicted Rossmann-fold nucleotide-binding protein